MINLIGMIVGFVLGQEVAKKTLPEPEPFVFDKYGAPPYREGQQLTHLKCVQPPATVSMDHRGPGFWPQRVADPQDCDHCGELVSFGELAIHS